MDTRNRGLGVAIGAMFTLALILPAVAVAKSSGSIRTTTDAACAPQNANTYAVGDWVYLAGSDFGANATFSWTIDGLPGGASADPGVSVAQGAGTTDADGTFCFQAYRVAADDLGVYKATVVQGTASKSDNYTVEAAPVEDPIIDPADTGSDPADTGSDPADTGAGAQQDLRTEPETVSQPVDDTPSDPADDVSGPTQQVLGETSGPTTAGDEQLGAETSSGSPQMPSTDTIETTSGTGLGSVLIGLALIAGTAILFAPNRRRDVRA